MRPSPNDRPGEALIRCFFYLSGFARGDGALKVVAGSHRWRDPNLGAHLREWREAGKTSRGQHCHLDTPYYIVF
jgi:hypothetical protein